VNVKGSLKTISLDDFLRELFTVECTILKRKEVGSITLMLSKEASSSSAHIFCKDILLILYKYNIVKNVSKIEQNSPPIL